MLIYKIVSIPHPLDSLIESAGITVRNIPPARFSFITSMRIATECKQALPDALFVFNKTDAAAAVSARSLQTDAGKIPYPIFFSATHDAVPPKSISKGIADSLDGIIFDSEETKKRWKGVRNISATKTHIIPPADIPPDMVEKGSLEGNRLLYAGALDQRINPGRFFDFLASHHDGENIEIHVAGTGKAGHIMPLVKRTRTNRLNIKWLGDDYDLTKEISECQGFIPSGCTPCPAEIQMLALGIPAVTTDNFDKWLDKSERFAMQRRAREIYETNHSPERYIENLKKLIH